MNISDGELAALIANGNQAAFDELIRRYGRLIEAIVKFHLKDLSMWQDDCVNEILFVIWQNADKFDSSKNSLKNWVGAVAKYRCINFKRMHYRELLTGELTEDITDGKEIDAEIIKNELDSDIESLLSSLRPEDREIFIKHYIYEVPVDELASQLDKRTDWIYNRISRCRKRLRKIYGKE